MGVGGRGGGEVGEAGYNTNSQLSFYADISVLYIHIDTQK